MPQALKKKSIKSIVRLPKQDRARITIEAILESAFQILETEGLAGFKVARLAERAGYSVGTLYQYFDNIDAVMLALVEADQERQRQTLLARFGDLAAQGAARHTIDLVHVMLEAFGSRRAAQRAIIDWALSRPDVRNLDGRNTFIGQLLASVSARSQGLEFTRLLSPVEMVVLSRAFISTLRTAIWSDAHLVDTPAFALGLADLVDGYIGQLARRDDDERKAREMLRGQRTGSKFT